MLGGEGGDAGELDLLLAGTQGVADGEDARVEQADDVACVGFIDDGAVLRHQLGAGGQLDVLALLHMVGFHAALELARADAHEGDTVAVGLVHVGLNFEDEGRELIAAGVNGLAGQAVHAGQRGGGEAEEVLEEGLDAEVGQRRAEEHGAQLAAQHAVEVKFLGSAVQQLDLVHQLLVQVGGEQLVQCGIAQLGLGLLDLLDAVGAAVAGESKHFAGVAVEHALELLAAADGPVHGVGLDAQNFFDVLHQLEGVAGLAVHLVDEGEDGDVAQGADLEQLDGLGLNALGGVDDHDRGIRCHQGAVGILREVLMARGVQNVHALACVVELQHRGSDGDAALLLDVHPVGHGVLCALLALDRACLIDGSAVQQQLFGQRRFAGVGVADDRKRPAALDFFTICHISFVLLRCGPAKGRVDVSANNRVCLHGKLSYKITYNAYFNRKSTWMQEFLLFFQNKAGQGRGVGPVGKIAHQYGIFFQRESPQPAEDALLFVRADDAPAVEDGAEHAADAQRREGGFQRRDAAVCCGEDAVVGPGQPAEVEHHDVRRAGPDIL